VFLIGEKRNACEYINASDISVLITKGEGFSNAIMESMALAKPVIATNVGGNPELLGEDDLSGYLVKEKDYESLANVIMDLHNNRNLRNHIGIKAKERVFRLCARNKNMENIREQFEALCTDN
jgi:glycosyltransferase involved in cell wall biosynthesis